MKRRKLMSILLVLLMLISLAGCGASSATEDFVMMEQAPAEMENGLYRNDVTSTGGLSDNRKLIVTVYLDAETEDLDALLSWLDGRIGSLQGYVENQSIYNGSNYSGRRYRNADLTIRIPAETLDSFVDEMAEATNIVSNSLSREDVTLNYVDTESRLKALQTEEARLLELMAQAETMSDLLEIEARLTEVRYELESAASRLRTYDNLVDYATIHLSISEVQEYTPVEEPSVWERIGTGFVNSVKGLWNTIVELFVFLIVASPYLLVLGGIAAVVVFLVKRKGKKSNSPKNPPEKPGA